MELELFIGKQECPSDEKRRFSIPPKFRPLLDQEKTPSGYIYHLVVVPWYGGSLAIFSVTRWREIQSRLACLEYITPDFLEIKRRCLTQMEGAHTDPEARLTLSPDHYAWLRLNPKGKDRIVVTGVGQYLEAWNAAEWDDVERTGKNAATRSAAAVDFDKQLELLMRAAIEAERARGAARRPENQVPESGEAG